MDDEIKEIIFKAIKNIINNSVSEKKINRLKEKHNVKVHFIPKKFRILGGILQSMNIQFGNFIEELISLILEKEGKYEIIKKYSGKKSNLFNLSKSSDRLIDRYITNCQINLDKSCNEEFPKLQEQLINDKDVEKNGFKHDIDLLFKDRSLERYFYIEIKYNDDHDTGKFIDINRKFIKTYAYLISELKIKNVEDLVPILFYFNNKRMKGNPYIPEETNIMRGEKFFKNFLSIDYKELNEFMEKLSEDDKTLKLFEDLYNHVSNIPLKSS